MIIDGKVYLFHSKTMNMFMYNFFFFFFWRGRFIEISKILYKIIEIKT